MKRVTIESPYKGNIELNTLYARAALLDSLQRGEAPLAAHLLYPQVLDEASPAGRKQGINCGLAWLLQAELVCFYVDLGMSEGMFQAQEVCTIQRIPTEIRRLGEKWNA